jgi:hypothetical protein
MKQSIIKKLLKCQSGIAAIEFAFIIPFLIALFVGLIDATQYMTDKRKIQSIAGTVADLIGQQRDYLTYIKATKSGDLDDFFRVPALIMKPQSDANVRVKVAIFGLNGTAFEQRWTVSTTTGTDCPALPASSEFEKLSDGVRDVIVVQVCTESVLFYDYVLDKFNDGKKTEVSYYVSATPRVSNKIACYNSKTITTGASNC